MHYIFAKPVLCAAAVCCGAYGYHHYSGGREFYGHELRGGYEHFERGSHFVSHYEGHGERGFYHSHESFHGFENRGRR